MYGFFHWAGHSADSHDRGTTVFELLVGLSIAILLGGLALPEVGKLRATFNRMNAQAYLAQDLKRAQAESVTQGCRGIFVIAPDGQSYSFGCDYLEYSTADPPQPDVVTLTRHLPEGVILTTPSPIIFNSKGQAVDVDGIISNLTISLKYVANGSVEEFAVGLLLGTGVFSFSGAEA